MSVLVGIVIGILLDRLILYLAGKSWTIKRMNIHRMTKQISN